MLMKTLDAASIPDITCQRLAHERPFLCSFYLDMPGYSLQMLPLIQMWSKANGIFDASRDKQLLLLIHGF